MALTDKLTSIANAIRSKTGGSNSLTLDEMPGAIRNIEPGNESDALRYKKLYKETIDGSAAVDAIEEITVEDLEGIKKIRDYAFYYNVNLERIAIPEGVQTIGISAFEGAFLIESLILPDSVQAIYDKAFRACYGLKSITIGANLVGIYDSAFYGCYSLTDVYYKGTEEQWANISIDLNNECLTNATIHYNS